MTGTLTFRKETFLGPQNMNYTHPVPCDFYRKS